MAYIGGDLLPRGGPINDQEEEQIGLVKGQFKKAKRDYREDMLTQIEDQFRKSNPGFGGSGVVSQNQVTAPQQGPKGTLKEREAALVQATGYDKSLPSQKTGLALLDAVNSGFDWLNSAEVARIEGQVAATRDAINQRPSERFKVNPSQSDKVGRMIAQGGLDSYFAGNRSINSMERRKLSGVSAGGQSAGQAVINQLDPNAGIIRNVVESSDPKVPEFDELVAKYGTDAGKVSEAFLKGYQDTAKGISRTPNANLLLDAQYYIRNPNEAFESALDTTTEIVSGVVDEGVEAIEEFFKDPGATTKEAWDDVREVAKTGGEVVKKAAKEVYDFAEKSVDELFGSAKTGLDSVASRLTGTRRREDTPEEAQRRRDVIAGTPGLTPVGYLRDFAVDDPGNVPGVSTLVDRRRWDGSQWVSTGEGGVVSNTARPTWI